MGNSQQQRKEKVERKKRTARLLPWLQNHRYLNGKVSCAPMLPKIWTIDFRFNCKMSSEVGGSKCKIDLS
jgi:hypothetical protein